MELDLEHLQTLRCKTNTSLDNSLNKAENFFMHFFTIKLISLTNCSHMT